MTEIETFRRQMPPPLGARPLNIPEPLETALPNGLRLVFVEDRRLPLISFRLAIRSGDANDPPELPGLSDMLSSLLTEGTENRSSRQLAEEIERLGATLNVGSGSDFMTIAASAISIFADEVLDLLAEVVLHPSFPQNEIDLARVNTKQLLIQQRAQPTFLASERLAQVMFGAHPYSRVSPSEKMLDAMTRDGLLKFHRSVFIPNNAAMIVVGDFDQDAIVTRIQKLFNDWTPGKTPELNFPAPPKRIRREAYLVDRPGSAQSNIVIANEAITRDSPDYFPMLLMHTVLGANASSRLFMNLREEKGYTYGAYSNLDARRLAGTFRVSAEVRTPVTEASLREFFSELERIRSERVADDELNNAKAYLTGVFPIRIETQDGLIDQLVSIKMLDLSSDYLHAYRDRVSAVTAEQIQQVAGSCVTPDRAAIVVVGDAAEVRAQIEPFTETLEIYDTEGNRKE